MISVAAVMNAPGDQVSEIIISYVATLPTGQAGDQSGLTSTTTRTVIIQTPSIVPSSDASGTAAFSTSP